MSADDAVDRAIEEMLDEDLHRVPPMSAPKGDGGAAFPALKDLMKHEGMSLRDWFAGQALPQLYVACETRLLAGGERVPLDTIARGAYAIADAMLRAREAPDA